MWRKKELAYLQPSELMQVFEYSRSESCNAVVAEIPTNSMGELIRQSLYCLSFTYN